MSLSEARKMLLVFGGALALVAAVVVTIMLWGAFANLVHVAGSLWHYFKNLLTG